MQSLSRLITLRGAQSSYTFSKTPLDFKTISLNHGSNNNKWYLKISVRSNYPRTTIDPRDLPWKERIAQFIVNRPRLLLYSMAAIMIPAWLYPYLSDMWLTQNMKEGEYLMHRKRRELESIHRTSYGIDYINPFTGRKFDWFERESALRKRNHDALIHKKNGNPRLYNLIRLVEENPDLEKK